MTEADFREILRELDELVRVRKVGASGETWVALADLHSGKTVEEIRRRLASFPVDADVSHQDGTVWLKITDRPQFAGKPEQVIVIPKINLFLFLATVVTTLLAGSVLEGGNPFVRVSDVTMGIPFSITLLLILGCHEFGHYFYARKHHVDVTLPYFIPAPTFIGTLGALIRIKSPIHNRKALLEIGASGPIAGFLVAVPLLFLGLSQSQVVHIEPGTAIILGDSLLMKFATTTVFPGLAENEDIMLNSVAFAGWIGLLVTMLNLLPLGQLDGGHIAYAIMGEKHNQMAKWAFLMLIPLSFFSLNWLIWGGLILLLMRSVKHPPILDMTTPLESKDRTVGIACLIIFVICFVPVPFG
ncbi:MAG: site-2 protease family protein [Candidatus Marinimicrobia bacterium]|jgi:membrane-associated protease RseP (regulator of RpoE activity)|nr:site-2 protease family protein [Candidatus Neomarinimicrobiota bacterium]MDP6592684.1 site-2 protease family protein [Candidatus Neomarinimicrobiota bacterium]MDP6837251.1 site-2 protease family protein [Candidatus Neomarinimicrobiota bacterium]MDP6965755.1 site-2 protease family protein [Candidatus Neomarinimicrobiota bacterium]|tara:strand:- start:3677 stop:4744 length:1068 start_codon:yes stop_codon:yes gene_type:complete